MRHANYSGNADHNTTLKTDSVAFLENQTIPKLIKHVGKVEIAIICSPVLRAVLTANVLREVLKRQGYTIVTHVEPILRDGSTVNLSNDMIDSLREFHDVPDHEFCICITHNPIIERSLGREIDYCTIVGHDFEISGHN